MGILADFQIKARCDGGMVTPFDPALVNPASLDVRLGNTLLIESAQSPQLVPYPLEHHSQEHPYMMRPGEFVLAQTLEVFNIPVDLAAQFVLKSSRAREGIEHLLAGFADPGFNGSVMTLELHNSRQLHAVPIWPGMKIGQMIFYVMADVPIKSYAVVGNYNGDQIVTASRGHL
jgi:dCTP deaminase